MQLEAFALRYQQELQDPAMHACFSDHLLALLQRDVIAPLHAAHCAAIVKGQCFEISTAAAEPVMQALAAAAAPVADANAALPDIDDDNDGQRKDACVQVQNVMANNGDDSINKAAHMAVENGRHSGVAPQHAED